MLATATQPIVGPGQEGMFQVRSVGWREGRECGSHQSFTRKRLDEWSKSAGLVLRVAYFWLALKFLSSIMLKNQHMS
jgi:hypothetical protein